MERQELDGIARSEGGLVAVTKVISITQVNLIMISSKNYSDQDFMVKKWFQSLLSLGGGRGCSDSYRVQRVFSSAQVFIAILILAIVNIFILFVILTIFVMFSSRLTEAAAQLSVLSSVICGEEPTSVRGELLR